MYILSLQLDYKLFKKRDLISYHLLLLVTQMSVMTLLASRSLSLMMRYNPKRPRRMARPHAFRGIRGRHTQEAEFLERPVNENNVFAELEAC